jgi:double-stranded uracil-DNA glycosylase
LSVRPAEAVKRSFPPIVDANCRLLVLGTLPGEESLRRREYYAHPRNLFWPIVFGLFGLAPTPAYDDRVAFVLGRDIALWDVCAAAHRLASADTTIRGEEPNAIDALLDRYPAIRAIAFNGSTARRLYDRHFTRRPDRRYLALPSTSPAHARLGFAEKLASWRVVHDSLIGD